jgi:hypothetical protein
MVYWMERRIFGGGTESRPPGGGCLSTRSRAPLSAGHAHRCLRAALTSWSSNRFPPSCSPRPRSPCRAASSTSASASALSEARELVVPSHFRYGEAGAALSAAGDARPARPGISRGRRPLHPARAGITRAAPFASSPATPDARPLRAPAAGAGLSHPAARHRSAQSAAGAVPLDAQRRPLRHVEFSGRAWTCRAKR